MSYLRERLQNVFSYNIPQQNKINFLLSSLSQQHYLLVFDDVHELLDDHQSIKHPDLQMLFNALLTQAHQSKVLIVSRIRPVFHRYQASQAKNTLKKMDMEDGIELLQILGVEENERLLEEAYQLTDGHPLAMELLASLTEVMPLEDILSNKALFYGDVNVAEQLLQKLYDTLTAEEQTLLLKISILPRPAKRGLICYLGEDEKTPQILNALVRKALITYDKKQKIYRQHDLVRDFHRLKMTKDEMYRYHLKAAAYYENLEYNQEKPTFDQVQQRLEARYHYFRAREYEKAAQILVEVSERWREWGYLKQCKILLEETLFSLERLELTDERKLFVIDLCVELGWVEWSFDSFDKAIQFCRKAEGILKLVEDRKRAGDVYLALGRFIYGKLDWQEAAIYLHRAFEIKKQEKDTKGLVKALSSLRVFYWFSGQIEKLADKCQVGLTICEEQQDLENKSEILNIIARHYRSLKRLDEALKTYQDGLSLKKADDFLGKATTLREIGQVLHRKKLYYDALNSFEESLKLAHITKDIILQCRILRDIGDIYREQEKIDEAIKKYEDALKLVEHTEHLSKKGDIIREIGISYENTDKFDEALSLYEKALQIFQKLGYTVRVAGCLDRIGNFYFRRLSDLNKALRYLQERLEIVEKASRTVTVENAKQALVYVYIELGNLDAALKISEELFQLKKQRGDPKVARTMIHLGLIHYIKGELRQALEMYKKILQLNREKQGFDVDHVGLEPQTLNHLGEVYIAFGNYEEALNVLEESLQLQRQPFRKAEPLTNIAEVYYLQGKFAEAVTKCEESLVLSRTYGGRIQSGKALHLMGKIRLQEKNYVEALQHAQEAVTIFRETGSRHLSKAEEMLKQFQSQKMGTEIG